MKPIIATTIHKLCAEIAEAQGISGLIQKWRTSRRLLYKVFITIVENLANENLTSKGCKPNCLIAFNQDQARENDFGKNGLIF